MKLLKTSLLCLSLFSFNNAFACSPEDYKTAALYSEQAFGVFFQDSNEEMINKASGLLDKSVELCPDNAQLILNRANFNLLAGNYEKVKSDYKLAAKLQPLTPEVSLLECVLAEYTQAPKDEWTDCYRQAEQKFTQRQKERLSNSYVLATLLAENPDSETIKAQWLEKNKNDNDEVTVELRAVLKGSPDRIALMKKVFPLK